MAAHMDMEPISGKTMSEFKPIRVLTVDDHPLLREGIAGAIASQKDMILVGEAISGEEAIAKYRMLKPDVTLMDLQMHGMNGIDAMIAIRGEFPNARFVVLTTYQGDTQAYRAIRAGAAGYLLKSMLRKDMLETIRTVHAGRRYIPPEIASKLADHIAEEPLTDREIAVLRLVAVGTSNKMIADRLEVAEHTVKSHLQNILAKLGANDRTHAVTIAMKRGFIEPE
jgi:DNA-binding NarL/FixJ family response regulator